MTFDGLISRKEKDGWVSFRRANGEEVIRVQMPEDVTHREIETFIEHLKKLAEQKQVGPN